VGTGPQPAAGLKREVSDGPFMFASERGGLISADTAALIVTEAAEVGGIGSVHAEMLRRAGQMLADGGLDTGWLVSVRVKWDAVQTGSSPYCPRHRRNVRSIVSPTSRPLAAPEHFGSVQTLVGISCLPECR
jgi:hypothetical protein